MKQWILGVDEAGRGPLAGPVAVGVVLAPADFSVIKAFPGVADSKTLTPEKRDALYEMLVKSAAAHNVRFCVRFASAAVIDTRGISAAVRGSVYRGVRTLMPDAAEAHVYLDGLLKAPPEYLQTTIIRGDATEPIISLASIVAKVSRDRLMHRLARRFPEYGFEIHKGYPTALHYRKISEHGLCEVHRKSFCKNI